MSEAKIIDGKARAAALSASIAEASAKLVREHGVRPGLAVILVGSDPASEVYVRLKTQKAEALGFHSEQHTLPAQTSQAELLALVERLNANPRIHGILVQLPLPAHLGESTITRAIAPTKDVDGLHETNVGRLATGNAQNAFVPCTPAGCMLLIEDQLGEDLSGREAIVIGRSNIVGKPVANLLLRANATVTIAHSRTRNLPELTQRADIVVAAVGRPKMVKADWIKPGAVVIDVGVNRIETAHGTRLTGDVDFEHARRIAGAITPVPGGVGPMTIAMLMANTLLSAQLHAGMNA